MKPKKKPPISDTRPTKRNPLRGILLLLVLTALLVFLYELSIIYRFYSVVMWIYLISLCGLLTAYIILNRGLSARATVPDELPEEWSPAEKQRYLDAERQRRRTARKLMYLILPIVVVFLIEMIDLYYADKLKAFFTTLFGGGA